MQQQTPRFKPSQKMKKRYILFEYGKAGGFSEAKDALFSLNLKPLKLIEFDSASKKGIVRCERSNSSSLKKAMEQAGFKLLKTSGSLKKLHETA